MFFDASNNPIPSYVMTLSAGSSYVMVVRIDCRSNLFLKSESVSDITVEGRLQGNVSWIDLESSSIDLTPYAGTRQSFEIRITAAAGVNVSKRFKLYTE